MTIPILDFTADNVVVHGNITDPRLNQSNSITINSNFSVKNGWEKISGTVGQLFQWLSVHEEGTKFGLSLIPGELNGKKRKARKMKSTSCCLLDIDDGTPIEFIINQVKKKGHMALLYTTHSHGSKTTRVSETNVIKKYGGDYSDQNVLDYLICEKGVHTSVFEGATVSSEKHSSKGVILTVNHNSMPKSRLLLPFAKDFCFGDAEDAHANDVARWKHLYQAVATSLDIGADKSCQDAARTYFAPRHDEGNDFEVHVIIGDPLDIDSFDIESVKASSLKRPRSKKSNMLQTKSTDEVYEYQTPWLMKFLALKAKEFDAEALFEDHCERRTERSDKNGWHYQCPNSDQHGNTDTPSDTAFFVASSHNNGDKGFAAHCMHNSCCDFDRAVFLDFVILDNDISEEELLQYCEGDDSSHCEEDDPPPVDKRQLPCGFYYSGNKIVIRKKDEADIRICSAFQIVGKAKFPDGTGHCIIIKTDSGIIVHSLKELHEDPRSLIGKLADSGVTVVASKRNLLIDLLSQVPDLNLPEKILAEQPGYIGDHYILPSGIVVGEPADKYILSRLPNSDAWKKGSLEAWKATAHKAWIEGNNLMRLALLLSGAAMLSNYLEQDGFVFATTGSSSKGKTTALKLAASFFGNPKGGAESCFVKLKGTENGMESVFEKLSGSLSCCDELSMFEGDIQKLIFMITEGTGKIRANQRGDHRDPKKFRGAALISSETSVVDMFEKTGRKAAQGMQVRCFDVDISNIDTIEDESFNEIVNGFTSNYGHACEPFAEELIRYSQQHLQSNIRRISNVMTEDEPLGTAHLTYLKRASLRFGLVEMAGLIMQDCDLIPLDKGPSVIDVVDWAWELSIANPTKKLGKPVEQAIDLLRKKLASKKGREFACLSKGVDVGNQDPKAYYSVKKNVGSDIERPVLAYIPEDILLKWSGGTCTLPALRKELKRQGLLDIASIKNVAHKTIPHVGGISHYRIDLEKFNVE